MLLTCKSCGNTYVIDDAEWRDPDGEGKMCEQCQEPLAPLVGGGAAQDSTTILEGYSFDGLKASMEAGQGGGHGAQAGPGPQGGGPGAGAQGGGPGAGAHGGGPGAGGQGGPPPPTQALDPVGGAQEGPGQGGWGGQGNNAIPSGAYGPPPGYSPSGDGGYSPPQQGGAPPGMGGDYPPPPGMSGSGGGQPPPPTQALDPVAGPDGEGDPVYIGSDESTMAIDLDNLQDGDLPGMSGGANQGQAAQSGSGGGDESTASLDLDDVDKVRKKKQLVIGAGGGGNGAAPHQHDERTAAIDLNQANAYARNFNNNPGAAQGMGQPGQMQGQGGQMHGQYGRPGMAPGMGQQPMQPSQVKSSGGGAGKVILVIFLVLILLGGGAVAVWYFVAGSDDAKSSSSASSGDDGESEMTFVERVAAAKAAPGTLMLPPVEGEIPTDGVLVAVGNNGVFVGEDLVVPFSGSAPPQDQLAKGTPLMPQLFEAFADTDPTKPIILLLDQGLSLKAAFPAIYTAAATGRRTLIGGSTVANPNSVGTVELNPWEWPKPPQGEHPTPTKPTDYRFEIDKEGVTFQGKGVNSDEGADPNSVEATWIELPMRLPRAIADAKGAKSDLDSVRFAPSPDLSVGKLLEVAQLVRGNPTNPRFTTLYLEAP